MKAALITGITGQDGSYLAEMLLNDGVQVFGTTRNLGDATLPDTIKGRVTVIPWDMCQEEVVVEILSEYQINEIYNFAAFSSGEGMFDQPLEMININGLSVVRLLESMRQVNPSIRFCQASSSEMFGYTNESPQTECSPFCPRTPYGAAKLYAHNMIDIYRRQYGLFACSAILFNHESVRRDVHFVTRKVAQTAAAIKLGLEEKLTLNTLDSRRDWGYARDYVNAMRLMLANEKPEDYVIATGKTHSVRDLCESAFGHVDLDYRDFVEVEFNNSRAYESVQLVGDSSRACDELGWSPTLDFQQLVCMMVDHEIKELSKDI